MYHDYMPICTHKHRQFLFLYLLDFIADKWFSFDKTMTELLYSLQFLATKTNAKFYRQLFNSQTSNQTTNQPIFKSSSNQIVYKFKSI